MIKVEMCRNGSSLNLLKQREKGRVSTHGKKSTMFCLFAALSDALRAEIQRLKGVTGEMQIYYNQTAHNSIYHNPNFHNTQDNIDTLTKHKDKLTVLQQL